MPTHGVTREATFVGLDRCRTLRGTVSRAAAEDGATLTQDVPAGEGRRVTNGFVAVSENADAAVPRHVSGSRCGLGGMSVKATSSAPMTADAERTPPRARASASRSAAASPSIAPHRGTSPEGSAARKPP